LKEFADDCILEGVYNGHDATKFEH
jgi:hypothetical protein